MRRRGAIRRRRGDVAATPSRRRDGAMQADLNSVTNISCSQHFRAAVTGKPAKLNNFNAFYGLLLRGFFPGEQVRLAGDDFLVEVARPLPILSEMKFFFFWYLSYFQKPSFFW